MILYTYIYIIYIYTYFTIPTPTFIIRRFFQRLCRELLLILLPELHNLRRALLGPRYGPKRLRSPRIYGATQWEYHGIYCIFYVYIYNIIYIVICIYILYHIYIIIYIYISYVPWNLRQWGYNGNIIDVDKPCRLMNRIIVCRLWETPDRRSGLSLYLSHLTHTNVWDGLKMIETCWSLSFHHYLVIHPSYSKEVIGGYK